MEMGSHFLGFVGHFFQKLLPVVSKFLRCLEAEMQEFKIITESGSNPQLLKY